MAKNTLLHKARGWISIAILGPVAIAAALSPLHWPAGSWGHFCCQSAGWLLFLAGAGMRWWATLYVGGRKSNTLVTDGPYSITRHPVYLGTFLLTLAVGAFSQSLSLVLATVAARLAYVGVTVPPEERRLRTQHGAAFDAYAQRVPRFLPKPWQFSSPETIEVRLRGLWIEFTRMCRWVWIPILCELLVRARTEPWWPIWFRLP
jgi:protein-S-isoprenylcysteine O-methyltransferase Ste14